MPNDLVEIENDTWLTMNHPTAVDYQEKLEELLALENYVGELQAQVTCLNDVALELVLAQEQWRNPELLLAS